MSETETIRFPLAGMTCASCVNRITRSLGRLGGVSRVRVDLRHETATLSRDPALVSDAALAAAVAGAGYVADLDSVVIMPPAEPRGLLARFLGSTR